MKSVKYIALGVLVTFGILSAVFYSSCSKDSCGAVTCLNKTSCNGGICDCAKFPGIGGSNCEIVYRKLYSNAYKGYASGTAPHSDSLSTLTFSADADTANFTTMHVDWIDTNALIFSLPIALSNFSASGATFSITPTTVNNVTVAGNGNISTTAVSMDVTETATNGGVQTLHFYNFNRQ